MLLTIFLTICATRSTCLTFSYLITLLTLEKALKATSNYAGTYRGDFLSHESNKLFRLRYVT